MGTLPLKAVCLDAYGTLCGIGDRRDPYRSLFRLLGVDPRPAARLAMTCGLGLGGLAAVLAPGRDADLSAVAGDLEAEVASVRLFADAADALGRLRGLGLRLWVASNLAPPYAVPVRSLLAGLVDGFCLSCEVGAVKPEAAFFAELCSRAGCPPGQALMAGDSLRSDVGGARAFGMRAVHLAREAADAGPGSVRSLAELAGLLERAAAGRGLEGAGGTDPDLLGHLRGQGRP
jgi:phosphoglycolate phosphatase-like HAD superfamily hydrolase